MNAGQQAPMAPFDLGDFRFSRAEFSAQDDSFAFQRLEAGVGLAEFDPELLGNVAAFDRTADFHQSADHSYARLFRRPVAADSLGNVENRIGDRFGEGS